MSLSEYYTVVATKHYVNRETHSI